MEATRPVTEKVPPGSLNPEFEKLAERTFRFIISCDPVRASWLGVHGKNDGLLPDRSSAAQDAELDGLRKLHQEFEGWDPRRLAAVQATELALVQGALGAQIALEERRPVGRLMPQLYLEEGIDGFYVLTLRDFAPVEARARALLGRLKAFPALLEQGKQNLESPPALFTESAVLAARGAEEMLRVALPQFLQQVGDAGLRAQCERALSDAARALESYSEFLLGSLMTRSRGEFRVGKVTFNRLLRDLHMIPFDADELIILGEKVYHETLRQIRATAARIRPGYNWSRLLQQLKEETPEAAGIAAAYSASIQAAHRFLQERKLVDLPSGDTLDVVPTPAFARPLYPYAGYVSPAPLEGTQRGTFWVTPVDPLDPPDRRRATLEGHCLPGIPVLAVHEAYPGHHLQLTLANRLDRKLRLLFTTPLFAEGWALYCEELMHEQGFFNDDRVRLMQLRNQLWRACRVIVDVGLHTGKMTFNEAASFLVRKAKLERPNATAEVRRYCENPTQPMSYVLGKLLIQELLGDYRAARGEQFSLRAFHDELLSEGTLPVELVRRALGIPRRAGEKEVLRQLTRAPRPAPAIKRHTRRPSAAVRAAGEARR